MAKLTPDISIHALRRERDTAKQRSWSRRQNFNPRAPQGARLLLHGVVPQGAAISIHALRRERDTEVVNLCAFSYISIHALRRERDACL